MNKIKNIIAVACCASLAGCASTSTQMVNSDGAVGNCGAWGFGIIGTAAALISTNECVKKYEAAGYHEIGSPPAPTPLSTNAVTSPAAPATLVSKDGVIKLVVPAGWIQAPPPTEGVQIYGKSAALDAGLFVSAIDLQDVQDWKQYSALRASKVAGNLKDGVATELVPTFINGLEGYSAEISGVSKNGIKLHYLGTVVKTEKRLVYFLSWSLESRFAVNRNALSQLPFGLQP